VYRELIGKRDDSQVAPAELRSDRPKAESVVFLWLDSDWRLHHADAPILSEIRALAQNFVLEIRRELVVKHSLP
jgi:hypothetical protein